MNELLDKVSIMVDESVMIPFDIKGIVKAICRGYVRESNGKIPLDGIENVCNTTFVKIDSDNTSFTGENKIMGETDTKYDKNRNVSHVMSYVEFSNMIKLVTILCHELGHVMTEFNPCALSNGVYGVVKRTAGIYTNCEYNDSGDLLASGLYGFRISDGFLESICSRIFASSEFREEILECGIDLKDYVYKDERLFPSRIYDEYKACFELFDYVMDGVLFDFSCKKYEDNKSLVDDINKYKLNTIFKYLDSSNDALWKLKRYERKESNEEFIGLLEKFRENKANAINLLYVLLDMYGKKEDDKKLKELLDVYANGLDKQKLLPISSTDFGMPSMS